MGASPWYVTRERVKAAIDSGETARNNRKVDDACLAASRSIDQLTGRDFYPQTATLYFDWPSMVTPSLYRIWVPDLLAVTSLTSGGTVVSASDYLLYPANARVNGEPYTSIELNRTTLATWQFGDTHQRSIAVAGVWGYCNDTALAGTLTSAVTTTTEATIAVSDSASVGIGDAVLIDSEYMIVTGKSLADTGQTVQTPMTASAGNTSCVVTDGTAFTPDEVITLDSERMLIEDVAGNTLVVRRAYDGSALAAHTGSAIYAPRTLAVTRGALGSTAATHLVSAAVSRNVPPGPVATLAKAEALNILVSDGNAWARNAGEGVSARPASGVGLPDLRRQVEQAYSRVTYRGGV